MGRVQKWCPTVKRRPPCSQTSLSHSTQTAPAMGQRHACLSGQVISHQPPYRTPVLQIACVEALTFSGGLQSKVYTGQMGVVMSRVLLLTFEGTSDCGRPRPRRSHRWRRQAPCL